jgi:hypothetical protein
LSGSTVPPLLLVVAAAGSLVFAGTFLLGPEYAAATGRARALTLGLAVLGLVALGLAILGLLTLAAHQP